MYVPICVSSVTAHDWSLSLRSMPYCLLSVGMKGTCCHTWLLSCMLEVELRFSCSCGRHFANWAISPTPSL